MPNIITLHACNDGSVSVSPWPENTDRMEVVPLLEYAALEARFVDWQRIMNDQLQRHRDEIRVIQAVVRELREDAAAVSHE